MVLLRCNLFGQATLFLDEKPIRLPYAKVSALLYYLLLKGQSNREEIAGLLWENKESRLSRKNLRNSIYRLNQAFGMDLVVSLDQQTLVLNPDLTLACDAHSFLQDPLTNLSLYTDSLLSQFSVRKSPAYENWLQEERQHFEQVYIAACQEKIANEKDSLSFSETKHYLEKLIALDEFEEANYLLLMKLYVQHGDEKRAISTYNQLVNLLDQELGVLPNKELQTFYQSIIQQSLQQKRIKSLSKMPCFIGREEEIKQVEYFLNTAFDGGQVALFLQGEDGSGKRSLIKQVLKNHPQPIHLLLFECTAETAKQEGEMWQHLKKEISLSHSRKEGQTDQTDSLQMCSLPLRSKVPHLLFIDGAQWLDKTTLAQIKETIVLLDDLPLVLIFSYNFRHDKELAGLKDSLLLKNLADYLLLPPFSITDSKTYLYQRLRDLPALEQYMSAILAYSQGNLFFLSQYAEILEKTNRFDPLPPLVRARLASQLQNISGQAESLLSYLACSQKGPQVQDLAHLTGIRDEELVLVLDELTDYGFLRQESMEQDIHLFFEQELLRLFLYDQLSPARIRMIHERIALYLKKQFDPRYPNLALLKEIISHYQLSNQPLKAIEHQLIELKALLRAYYDLFPISNQDTVISLSAKEMDQQPITQLFNNVHIQLQELEKRYSNF